MMPFRGLHFAFAKPAAWDRKCVERNVSERLAARRIPAAWEQTDVYGGDRRWELSLTGIKSSSI
jgi:hypothetical protein